MRSIVLIAALAIAAGSFANGAIAATTFREPVVREGVSYADLNLKSPHDQKRLRDRVAFAAYRLCLVETPASPSPMPADPDCYRNAMKDALKQMNGAIARADVGPALAAGMGASSR